MIDCTVTVSETSLLPRHHSVGTKPIYSTIFIYKSFSRYKSFMKKCHMEYHMVFYKFRYKAFLKKCSTFFEKKIDLNQYNYIQDSGGESQGIQFE